MMNPDKLTTRSIAPAPREAIGSKRLREREVQILKLVTEGLANKEIAERMKISLPLTLKLLRNAFKKLNVTRRTEAAVLWSKLAPLIHQRATNSGAENMASPTDATPADVSIHQRS